MFDVLHLQELIQSWFSIGAGWGWTQKTNV